MPILLSLAILTATINYSHSLNITDENWTLEDRGIADGVLGKCPTDQVYDATLGCLTKADIEPPPDELEGRLIFNNEDNSINKEKGDVIFKNVNLSEGNLEMPSLQQNFSIDLMYRDIFGPTVPNSNATTDKNKNATKETTDNIVYKELITKYGPINFSQKCLFNVHTLICMLMIVYILN